MVKDEDIYIYICIHIHFRYIHFDLIQFISLIAMETVNVRRQVADFKSVKYNL